MKFLYKVMVFFARSVTQDQELCPYETLYRLLIRF